MQYFEPIAFKLKKAKMILICLIFSAIISLLIFLMWFFVHYPSTRLRYRTYAIIIISSLIIALSFIQTLNLFLRLIFDRRIGLILNKNGITDHSGILSVGFIPWSDIISLNFSDKTLFLGFRTSVYITIELYDQSKFDNRGNFFSKFSRFICEDTIAINATLLTNKHDELLSLCQKYLYNYGKNKKPEIENEIFDK